MHAAPPMGTTAAIDVRPLTASIGATVHDLELGHASDEQVAGVRSAVLRHGVVFLRDQSLDDDSLRSVAGRFWRWAAGDLAIWDERSTCHRALVDHHPQGRRMRRCVVAGAPPVPA